MIICHRFCNSISIISFNFFTINVVCNLEFFVTAHK